MTALTVRVLLPLLCVLGMLTAEAQAQPYPNRPVRIVVPFPAGGTADVIVRSVTGELERRLGQPFIIDSRGGANGIIGTEIVAKAAPDGYTLLHITASFVINPSVYRKLPYRVSDFVPITNLGLAAGYLLVVNAALPAQTVPELIALAKSREGKLSYGSPGVGNTLHLAYEYFNMKAGIATTHVPYKGVAPAFTALLGGEVQTMFIPAIISLAQIRAGKVRALGFSGTARWPVLPDVPAIAETLPGFHINGGWHGWFAPAGTPAAIVGKLQSEVHGALQAAKVREFLADGGYEADGRSPAEFRKMVDAESERYAGIVRAIGLMPQ